MPSSGFQTCARSEEHTSELQSHDNLVCRLLLEKKKVHVVELTEGRGLMVHKTRIAKTLPAPPGLCLYLTPPHIAMAFLVLLTLSFFFYERGAHQVLPFSPPERFSH